MTAMQEAYGPVAGLSEALSLHSFMAQQEGQISVAGSPGASLSTPQGFTPTSRLGTAPLSALPRGSSLRPTRPATGDLLSGEPFLEVQGTPEQAMERLGLATPSGALQVRICVNCGWTQ